MKKLFKVLVAASMVLGLAACSSSKSDDSSDASSDGATQTFKIGGSGPTTGDYSLYGSAVQLGAQIAVDEINAANDGIAFELDFQDDQGDPEKAATAYGNLKDGGMQISLSTTTSGAGAAVSASYEEDKTFALTPSASNTAVVFKDDDCTESYGYVYQMCFTDPNQGVASADYIQGHEDLGTKVAVIYQSDENYSVSIYNKFKSEAKSKGLEIVSESSFTKNDKDFSTQLSAAKKAGADCIFLPIYYSQASLILTKANDMGYEPTFFGVDGMDGILSLEGFDTKLAEGVYLLTPFSADAEDEKTQAFVKAYEEKSDGVTPNQFAADAYDCVYALHQALKEGGATADMSNEEIAEILIKEFTSMTFDGLTGSDVTWKDTGEVSKAPKAVVIKDGAYASVED